MLLPASRDSDEPQGSYQLSRDGVLFEMFLDADVLSNEDMAIQAIETA